MAQETLKSGTVLWIRGGFDGSTPELAVVVNPARWLKISNEKPLKDFNLETDLLVWVLGNIVESHDFFDKPQRIHPRNLRVISLQGHWEIIESIKDLITTLHFLRRDLGFYGKVYAESAFLDLRVLDSYLSRKSSKCPERNPRVDFLIEIFKHGIPFIEHQS